MPPVFPCASSPAPQSSLSMRVLPVRSRRARVPAPRAPSSTRSPTKSASSWRASSKSLSMRPLARGRVLFEPHVLDLVEQGSIADLQHLGGLHAVPAALL